MNITLVLQGVLGSILSDVIFFLSICSRFFLIPSQSASLYIIASFEIYLIDETISTCTGRFVAEIIYLRQAYLTCLYCIP